MMSKKVVIVGGVAGGASAAARLRRLDETAEIILLEKGEHISYANCGLPYYIGDTIKDRNKLLVQTPQAMNSRFNIDVRVNNEVVFLDAKNKKLTIKSSEKGEYQESYDALVLSPGAKPIKPAIEGIDSNRIFTLRNVNDTDKIKNFIGNENVKSAVVIGGGYIGIEMAENLTERGIDVTLVEAAPHILAPFDSDMVVMGEKELQDNGVEIILKDGVKSFKDNESKIETTLASGTKLISDMAILAIGVTPDTAFLKDSGIEFGAKGHILVNEKMETNIKDIYAVGDAVSVVDFVNGNITAIPLAGPANKQGRIVADNICGLNTTYKGTQGTSIIKIFDLTGASTGNNERTLKNNNIPYKVVYAHPQCHAAYYPDASPLSIKLIFNEQGRILGAQAFGYDGVDKRIDDIANVIRFKGNVTDLTELELSYAPPYSSAKDPVNMIGYIAEDVLTGKVDVFVPEDLEKRDQSSTVLLDVRNEIEFSNGYIEGAINIPVDNLRQRINELPKEKEVWVYCQVGLRGYIASRILMQNGYRVKNLTGGYKTYIMSTFKPNKVNKNNKNVDNKSESEKSAFKTLDACGLCCPGPLMQVRATLDEMMAGETLRVTASDPGFYEDIKAWCNNTHNELLEISKDKSIITAVIKKNDNTINSNKVSVTNNDKDNKTIVVFSGDLDKAIASFIIANGALSMGKKVTMFFTFWGLNILRKPEKVSVTKGFMDKMFCAMMPRGSKKLKLSNMNMMGMGAKMIRNVMKDKNISSLEDLIKSAIDSGANLVACQMSMDVMGIKQEELIDGVKIGGVGYYLGEAEDSNVNLFI